MRFPGLLISLLSVCGAACMPAVAAVPMPPRSLPAETMLAPGPEHTRSARVSVGETAVENIVLRALGERRIATAGARIQLTAFSARLPITFETRLSVERISYQPAGNRFIAVLVATGDDDIAQRFTVAGRLLQTIEMPVPVRRLQAGEIIDAEDLQWVSLRDRRVSARAVQQSDNLIGRVARRTLPAGVPINATDVKRPVLIDKGAAVTVILEAPNMQLSVRGRAMEDGAVGQSIRVANLESRAIVIGVVTPAGQVAIRDLITPAGGDRRRSH